MTRVYQRSMPLLVGMLLLLVAACQQATQPVDLTASRTMTLELRTTRNEPIADATVDWTKVTGAGAPIGARVRTASDGFAQWVVPEVATSRDSVELVVNVPATAPTGAAGPFTFATSVCNDTLITLAIAPPTPCGTLNARDTILLETCPGSGAASSTACITFTSSCPDALIYTANDSSAGALRLDLRPTDARGTSLTVCGTYTPASNAGIGTTEQFPVRIEGRSATSGAVLVAYDVVLIGSVTCQPCPCPTFQPLSFTTLPVCVGTTAEVDIPLSTLGLSTVGGPDCVTEFALLTASDNVLRVTSGDRFAVRSGQAFPTITVDVTPSATGQVRRTLEWSVTTRNLTTGVVEQCPSRLTLDLTTNVLAPSCTVVQSTIDTLQKCVFTDSSTTDTFSIVNNGDCPITVTIASSSTLFSVSPSGSVTIGPRSRVTVRVGFIATKTDWDRNPATPIAGRGDKFFSGRITVTGCGPDVSFPVVGDAYVQCDAFKYQCLRQFRPPGYPNVYAESIQLVEDKTNIIYQNDNQTFRQYDVFVRSLTPNGGSFDLELGSGSGGGANTTFGVFRRIATGFAVAPGQSICDTYPVNAATECADMKSDLSRGTPTLGGLQPGDVVLYTKIGSSGLQCALIWIQSIGPDRPGPNSLPQACIEICYPMFTL